MPVNPQPLQLEDQIFEAFVYVLESCFPNPWTDDAAYSQTVNIVGKMPTGVQAKYPAIEVNVALPQFKYNAIGGGIMRPSTVTKNGKNLMVAAPSFGGFYDEVNIECVVTAYSISERRQISDILIHQVLFGAEPIPNGSGLVRWGDVFKSFGIRLKGHTRFVETERNQPQDTEHPKLFLNTFSFIARCGFKNVLATFGATVTVKPVLLAASVPFSPNLSGSG